ncbi:MAG: mechanosensitive ion channel domain-containing protein [Nanoarchaeota archaeon]
MDHKKIKSIIFVSSLLILSLILLFVMLKLEAFSSIFDIFMIKPGLVSLIPKILVLLLLFVLFKVFEWIISSLVSSWYKKQGYSAGRIASINNFIRYIILLIWVVISIFILVNNFATIIASVGLIGLGLTFALQKPILNMVGWLTIILNDLYNEGDRIKIGNIRGDVKEIQLMNTVLYSLLENSDVQDQKIVTVPNEMVLTTDVSNFNKGSNYVLDELTISITYESNYKSAMQILEDVIIKRITTNINSYIQFKRQSSKKLNEFLSSGMTDHKEEERLKREHSEIKEEIKELKHLSEEFNPKIRLEMADSSLVLIAQFLTPYNEIKKNRTVINIKFLEAIKTSGDIHIAYPHMEVIYPAGEKKNN